MVSRRLTRVVIDRVEVKNGKMIRLDGTDWSDVTEALGGGPMLVRDGKPISSYADESMGLSFATTAHPRTAIGVTQNTTVFLVVVDGHNPKLVLECL